MKKTVLISLGVILALGVVGIFIWNGQKQKTSKNDAIQFKEEYEAFNGKKTSGGEQTYRTITIPKDNPFIYKDASDIVKMIKEKKTFVVYFGFDTCPWCRSVLPTLIEVANDLSIDMIYYVDIKEIRDVLSVDEEGNIITEKEAGKGYMDLLKYLDPVLSDYALTDEDGEKIDTKEKRIYAPNVVSVVKGKAKMLKEGVSEKQTDGYMKLTEEMKKDTYQQFECVLKCVVENKTTCSNKGC